ncbi:MAG: conjugal transfer protein TraF [Nitrococcus mobilis]|nr:conjugal transfer protein TraF [Nitrococcus mobilis]
MSRRCAATALLAVLWGPGAESAQPGIDARLCALSGVGIWYFYRSTCPYCVRQEPILHALASRYDIPVTPISLDGGPPPGRAFDGYTYDRGQAAQLGVRVTPTLYLVHPATRQAVLLSAGLMSAQALKRRIVRAGEVAGWVERELLGGATPDSSANTPRAAAVAEDSILKRMQASGRRLPWTSSKQSAHPLR